MILQTTGPVRHERSFEIEAARAAAVGCAGIPDERWVVTNDS